MTRAKRSTALAMVAMVVAFLATMAVPAAGGEATSTEDVREPGLFSRLNRARLEWIAGTDAWIHAGPAFSFVSLLDTRMSPIVYAGPGVGVLLSTDVVRQRWLWPGTLTARLVRPTGSAVLPGSYESLSGEADVAILYRFVGSGFAAGGGVRSSVHVRTYDKLQNNSFNSDVIVALNASGRWETAFGALSRVLVFHVRADVPVVSWISRSPAYAMHGSASYLAPPTRYVRATIESGLTWPLRWSDQNTARLRYAWDFYVLDEFDRAHTVRIATHTLSLSLGARTM